MEIDKGTSKVYDKKKKTDEHGQYPGWMNQRAIRKQQQKNKKVKLKKGKKASAWWCSSHWERVYVWVCVPVFECVCVCVGEGEEEERVVWKRLTFIFWLRVGI